MNNNIVIVIWVVVIGGLFLFLWKKGYLKRLADYVGETREELRKCTWPTKAELKGSTVVVLVAVLLLGAYTVVVDSAVSLVVRLIYKF